jgi:hypothetical protein
VVPYLKPGAFVRRVFNPIAMKLGASGVSTLAVPRRRTEGVEHIPVIVASHAGARYVVSTRGEAEWVKNLRAAGGGELTRKGKTERFHAVEVPTGDRGPIIAAYRAAAGRAVSGYWKKLPDDADHPTFRVDPVPDPVD